MRDVVFQGVSEQDLKLSKVVCRTGGGRLWSGGSSMRSANPDAGRIRSHQLGGVETTHVDASAVGPRSRFGWLEGRTAVLLDFAAIGHRDTTGLISQNHSFLVNLISWMLEFRQPEYRLGLENMAGCFQTTYIQLTK